MEKGNQIKFEMVSMKLKEKEREFEIDSNQFEKKEIKKSRASKG